MKKNAFLVPCASLICTQQKETVMPWDWVWPTLIHGLHGILHREISLSSKGPALALGPLLPWCASTALEQVLFTPWKQPALQLDKSLWADQQTKDLWSKAEEEGKGHNILIMSPKEKNRSRVLEDAAGQSQTWSFQRFPVVTVALKASLRQCISREPRHNTSSTPGGDSYRNWHGTGKVSS